MDGAHCCSPLHPTDKTDEETQLRLLVCLIISDVKENRFIVAGCCFIHFVIANIVIRHKRVFANIFIGRRCQCNLFWIFR